MFVKVIALCSFFLVILLSSSVTCTQDDSQEKLNEMIDNLISYVLEDERYGEILNYKRYLFAGKDFSRSYTLVKQASSRAINHHSWKRVGDVNGSYDGDDKIHIYNTVWRIPSPAWRSGVQFKYLVKYETTTIPLNYTLTVPEVDLHLKFDIDLKKKKIIWGDFKEEPFPLHIDLPAGQKLEYKVDVDCPVKKPLPTLPPIKDLCADAKLMMLKFISQETYVWFRADAQYTIEKAYELWF